MDRPGSVKNAFRTGGSGALGESMELARLGQYSVVMSDVTQILSAIEQGDQHAADELLPLVYDELRKLAAVQISQERPGQTLQATALVHEAYLRLVDAKTAQQWNSRGHFFAAAAEAMRRILVEQARRKQSHKGGGELNRVELADMDAALPGPNLDLLALDEAIQLLEEVDSRAAQVVKLRFFAGLTGKQVAQVLAVSTATVDNDWAYAKSWIRGRLSAADD